MNSSEPVGKVPFASGLAGRLHFLNVSGKPLFEVRFLPVDMTVIADSRKELGFRLRESAGYEAGIIKLLSRELSSRKSVIDSDNWIISYV